MKKFIQRFNKIIIVAMLFCFLLPTPTVSAGVDDWLVAGFEKAAELIPIEEWFAGLFRGVANALNFLISAPVGYQITIDDVVFNEYAPVKVDYFESLKDGKTSELIWGANGMPGLSTTVNQCFSFFNKIAIMVYMVMLVYMGVRILLSSTGKSLSHYKTLFMYWVVGVAILFLYPFAMKYIIQVNNIVVSVISANKGVSTVFPENTLPAATTDSIEEVDFDKNPFNGAGTDYMSQIANEANETKGLALSFVYLILTWQLITIIIHYYKRLLMIGFLIAIFPLVAMFYAIDKIADGKSQAFDHWNKEFMLNVFIQSFHAIVYVFVCGSVEATMGATGFDYIIVITGATFLFTGEEIVKKIFTQSSGVEKGAAQGLGKTAAWNMAKVGMVTGIASKATKKVLGKDGAIMKARTAYYQRKAGEAKFEAFDKYATTVEKPDSGMELESMEGVMSNIAANETMDEAQKQAAREEAKKLANAVADLNNPNTRSVSELQEAYEIVQEAMQNDPNNVILGDLKLSPDQLSRLDGLRKEIATLVANGETDPVKIEQHIDARLGYYLGNDVSRGSREKYKNMMLYNLTLSGASRYESDWEAEESAEREVSRSAMALSSAFASFKYREKYDLDNDAEKTRKEEIARLATEEVERLHKEGEEATKEEKELAEGILVLANRNLGIYTAEEYLDAVKKVNENLEYDSDVAREIAKSFDMDIDILRHGLARQAQADGCNTEEVKEIVKEYETDVRDGYNDDEVSAHELIQLMYDNKDEGEKENTRRNIVKRVSSARKRTREYEREYTQAIAEDILFSKGVDVEAGKIDTETRFLNGQTKEDILAEIQNSRKNFFTAFSGFGDTPVRTTFSDGFVENMKNYSGHKNGDKK